MPCFRYGRIYHRANASVTGDQTVFTVPILYDDRMTRGPDPKVVRLIDSYGLNGLGDELERRWTDSEERASLRELAHDVNIRLLEHALDDADVTLLEGELENLYHLLTDDEVSRGARSEARSRLERDGIDVDDLRADFVSRQALHTYLTKHREASPPDSSSTERDHRERRIQSIQRLRSRLEVVTRSILTDLVTADRLTLGDFSVVVSVRVHCADCDTQTPVESLLERGGCDCEPSR